METDRFRQGQENQKTLKTAKVTKKGTRQWTHSRSRSEKLRKSPASGNAARKGGGAAPAQNKPTKQLTPRSPKRAPFNERTRTAPAQRCLGEKLPQKGTPGPGETVSLLLLNSINTLVEPVWSHISSKSQFCQHRIAAFLSTPGETAVRQVSFPHVFGNLM